MIKLETLKQLLETSLNNNNFEKFLRQLDEQPINKENFFDYLEDFKLNISSIFKRKLSNYEDDELMKTINDKLEDFESRLII